MDRDKLTASQAATRSRLGNLSATSSRPSSTTKRDSLAAELEKDPRLSTAKRQQRSQVFTSNLAHANLERQLVSAQTTRMELETKLREREIQVERLERDRRWLADREQQEKEERERERREYDEDKCKLEADLRSLRTALSTLREEHADLLDTHSSLSHTHAQSSSSHHALVSTLSSQTSHLESALAESRTLAEDRLHTITELHAQLDEADVQRESTAKRAEEEQSMGVVRQELQRQAGYLRDLERTNAKLQGELNVLRERHTSIEVLKEEKRALEKKVGRMDQLREQVTRLEAEVDAGRREREAWASRPSTASNTPVTLTETLSTLRLTHALLLEEHGSSTALLRRREAELTSLSEREAEAYRQVEALESDMGNMRDSLEQKEAKVRLVEREAGFLRAMLASYTLEQSQEHSQHDKPVQEVPLSQLETLLEEYKAANVRLTKRLEDAMNRQKLDASAELDAERTKVAKLEAALFETGKQLQMHLDTIKALHAKSEELEQKAKVLEDANESLEQTLHDLKGEMAGGRHVPPGVRVLCLKQNPESEWAEMRKEALERVKGENEALLRRCRELEGRVGDLEGQSEKEEWVQVDRSREGKREELVPRASWELVCREKEELEDVVRQKEKRLLRLKQIFESKGAEFRDAIASILGVKLAFNPNGNVRVTSIYDLTTSFVFQPTKSGQQGARMQLVAQGEGGPQDLPSLMEFWLEKEECIPGFMASVTLECYDNAKRNGEGV